MGKRKFVTLNFNSIERGLKGGDKRIFKALDLSFCIVLNR
jgi:hypothetical protein